MTTNIGDVVIIGGGIGDTAACYPLAAVARGDLAAMALGWTLAGVRAGCFSAQLLQWRRCCIRS